ncbi:hypothetical protein AMTR_s00183p00047260 [Amborella trichopoda]|uniref:Uncharacterized protein n=1 Tax=Amborella trichopoda TaxID=13333 RepID=U5D8L4_AMBTC|nr:hypothetical protein AMTR_s00183p00047260 [Amborella trichopoda]
MSKTTIVCSFNPPIKDLSMLQDKAAKSWGYPLACRTTPTYSVLMIFDKEDEARRAYKHRFRRFNVVLMPLEWWSSRSNPSFLQLPTIWLQVEGIPIHAWMKEWKQRILAGKQMMDPVEGQHPKEKQWQVIAKNQGS